MATAKMDIPFTPVSLNKILRSHYSMRQKERTKWGWAILGKRLELGIPECPDGEHRILHFTLFFPTRRRRDADNYLKVLLDGCCAAGLIYDDTPEAVTYSIAFDVDEREHTSIVIEWDGTNETALMG